MSDILLAGIYLAGKPNTAGHVAYECARSRDHAVAQRWAAIAPGGDGDCSLPGTVAIYLESMPKFSIIDRLTRDAGYFDWLIITDDDAELPEGFVDRFIGMAERYDFALCQPARSLDSFIDHGIVSQMPGIATRQTRFVEIGPLVAVRRDAMALLLPFGPEAGMGWGLDFIWPVAIEAAGLRLGIIDATPIAHRLRRPVTGYDHAGAARAMADGLASCRHLPPSLAFSVVEAYA
jgi:hypothetical protein